MIKHNLVKIASYLYRFEPKNESRNEIYMKTDHLHLLDPAPTDFTDKAKGDIKRVKAILDAEEKRKAIELKKSKRKRK